MSCRCCFARSAASGCPLEPLRYNLLFRWFVGLGMNEEVWHATVFTKSRDRLLEADVARQFFGEIVRQAKQRGWMSSERFSADGTMAEARASQKSFRPKQDRPDEDGPKEGGGIGRRTSGGQRRGNETHESVTDAETRLWRKSQTAEAKLSDLGHVLGENRHGLIVNVRVTRAYGRTEREAAVAGAKGRDTREEDTAFQRLSNSCWRASRPRADPVSTPSAEAKIEKRNNVRFSSGGFSAACQRLSHRS